MDRVPYVFCDHVVTNLNNACFMKTLRGQWGTAAEEHIKRRGDFILFVIATNDRNNWIVKFVPYPGGWALSFKAFRKLRGSHIRITKVLIVYRPDKIDPTVPVALDRLVSKLLPAIRPYIAFHSLFEFQAGKCPHSEAVNAILNYFTTTCHFQGITVEHYGTQ
uniref:SGNH domain-containing protein n=1 Tax=Steinernema glaseri TaxID=37863 RepID=A0A1I8AU72_9BILA